MRKIGIALIVLVFSWPALAATKTVTLGVKGWTCGSCAASTRIAFNQTEVPGSYRLPGLDAIQRRSPRSLCALRRAKTGSRLARGLSAHRFVFSNHDLVVTPVIEI